MAQLMSGENSVGLSCAVRSDCCSALVNRMCAANARSCVPTEAYCTDWTTGSNDACSHGGGTTTTPTSLWFVCFCHTGQQQRVHCRPRQPVPSTPQHHPAAAVPLLPATATCLTGHRQSLSSGLQCQGTCCLVGPGLMLMMAAAC